MSANCELCLKGISKARYPGVKCGVCVSLFHIKCARISEEVLKELNIGSTTWLCPDCRSKSNCSILDDPNDGSVTPNLIINDPPALSDLVIILQAMKSQLDTLEASVSFCCKALDDVKMTIEKLTKDFDSSARKISNLENKVELHDNKLNIIEAQLDISSQESNTSNIVVCGIPAKSEDIPNMIIKVIGAADIRISGDDIVSIKSMVHNKETASHLKDSYIVKLRTTELKTTILNTFRKKKFVYLHQLGAEFSMLSPNQKIWILHHFTRFQSRLYKAAKEIKVNYKYQFLWCKENKIFLRKTSDSRIHHIYSFNDINRLYKINGSSVPTPDISSNSDENQLV